MGNGSNEQVNDVSGTFVYIRRLVLNYTDDDKEPSLLSFTLKTLHY